jgi:hypothetical protein
MSKPKITKNDESSSAIIMSSFFVNFEFKKQNNLFALLKENILFSSKEKL